MSDAKKAALAEKASVAARIAPGLRLALRTPTGGIAGLPNGVRVVTNSASVTRFPLPLTIGAAVVAALGVIAAYKGHKKTGVALVIVGGLGIGAAGAAPEINGALAKVGAP